MAGSMHRLAHSPHYEIMHEYETVWLRGAGMAPVVIGDFYGDPSVAIIDARERWCAVAGLGLIVYFIEAPFEAYAYDRRTSQYGEMGRAGPEKWWVESLAQTGPSALRVFLEGGTVHRVSFQRTVAGCDFFVAPDGASTGDQS
jgi:hypothetical protein